jgi:tetratricopeptide (TPR) repeat protein
MIGLVQVGGQTRADRYTYLSQIGLFLILAWGGVSLIGRRWSWAGGVGVVLMLGWCANRQVLYWRNGEILWQHTLACTTANAIAHYNLGTVYSEQGRTEEAIQQYEKAVTIPPILPQAYNNLGQAFFQKKQWAEALWNYRKALSLKPDFPVVYHNLGNLYLQQGELHQAVASYQKALASQPDDWKARLRLADILLGDGAVDEAMVHYQKIIELNPAGVEGRINLANALILKGRAEEAQFQVQQVLAQVPDSVEAWVTWGSVFLQQNRPAEAINCLQRALQAQPRNAKILVNLALAFSQHGQAEEARARLRLALEIAPDFFVPYSNLAWLLATCPEAGLRDGTEAVRLAREASRLAGGQEPLTFRSLAAAQAETGHFAEAKKTAEQGSVLAVAQGKTELFQLLQKDIQRYTQKQPIREYPVVSGAKS